MERIAENVTSFLRVVLDERSPSHVRDGYLLVFVYLPAVFGQSLAPFVGQLIPAVLLGLADDSEFVRETALIVGQRIVSFFDTAVDLLLPRLEEGMLTNILNEFDDRASCSYWLWDFGWVEGISENRKSCIEILPVLVRESLLETCVKIQWESCITPYSVELIILSVILNEITVTNVFCAFCSNAYPAFSKIQTGTIPLLFCSIIS